LKRAGSDSKGLEEAVSEKSKGRVEETIRHLIAEALLRKVKDPRVTGVSITRVEVSSDYSFAKVMYNVVGGGDNVDDVQRGLDSCKGFIRRMLRGSLKTRDPGACLFLRSVPG